jgi:hypothetical protein
MNRYDITVANIGELQTVHVAELVDGVWAYVVDAGGGVGAYFALAKSIAPPVPVSDGVNVVAPIVGSPVAGGANARWFRSAISPVGPSVWGLQANWFVNDTTGLVTNDGTAAVQGAGSVGPIPFAEWARRIIAAGGVAAGVAMVVNVGSNITTMIQGTINVARVGSTLQILGASGVTNVRSGTLTPITTCVPATNTPWQGTDSLGLAWTTAISATATTGQRVRITTAGANLNTTFWPAKNLGAGACRFSQPIKNTALSGGSFATTMGAITNNDTYALEQLPIVTVPWGLSFYVDSFQGFTAGQEAVQIVDFAFSNTNIQTVLVSNANFGIGLYRCDLGSLQISCPCYSLVACRTVSYTQLLGTEAFFFGGLNMGNLAVQGFGAVDFRQMCQGGRLNVFGCAGQGFTIAAVQAFDATQFGGIAFWGGTAIFTGFLGSREVFGANNTNFGINIASPGVATYTTNTTGMTITGGTGDVNVAGTTKAYGALPFLKSDINAGSGTTFAGIIVAA